MGFDEENLEPFYRKSTKTNKQEQSDMAIKRSFLVLSDIGKRQILASCVDELKQKIVEKFKYNCSIEELVIEFWSDIYGEWILIDDQLPNNNSKIQIKSSIKSNRQTQDLEDDKINSQISDKNFVQNLNLAFKNYLESDSDHKLDNFETAVIFLLKRRKDKIQQTDEREDLTQIIQQHNITISNLNNELKNLKNALKQFKTEIEFLNDKINSNNINVDQAMIQSQKTNLKKSHLIDSTIKAIRQTNRKNKASCLII